MDITVTTRATATSIDKALVKASKRILYDQEDPLIDFWIAVADAYVENETHRSLMERTLTMSVSRVLPSFQIPYPPLASIESVEYTITDQTEVIVNTTTGITRRVVEMLPEVTIPALTTDYGGTMTIVYKAGHALPADVPPELRQASLLLAGHYLTSREAAYMDPRAILINREIAFGVNSLIRHWVIPNANEPLNGGY